MSYSVYLFKKEVRERFREPEQLSEAMANREHEFPAFSSEQKKGLLTLLKAYGYSTVANHSDAVELEFKKNESYGIIVSLFSYFLAFTSFARQDAVIEILMTSSEFCDDDFATFNLQTEIWSEDF